MILMKKENKQVEAFVTFNDFIVNTCTAASHTGMIPMKFL